MNHDFNSSPRTHRISTQISEKHGLRLERLQIRMRSDCGKKLKICEIIELAIDYLDKSSDITDVYFFRNDESSSKSKELS